MENITEIYCPLDDNEFVKNLACQAILFAILAPAVLTILTYCLYAQVVLRCPCANWSQQYTPVEPGA